MAQLSLLEEIERKADGYSVLNVLSNILLNIVGIYAGVQLSTYIWRMIECC